MTGGSKTARRQTKKKNKGDDFVRGDWQGGKKKRTSATHILCKLNRKKVRGQEKLESI